VLPRGALLAPKATRDVAVIFVTLPNTSVGASVSGLVQPDGKPLTKKLDSGELLGAMLAWCRTLGIPLPRRGQKSVELFGTSVGLSITLNAVATDTAVDRNGVRYHDPECSALQPD